MPLNLRVDWLLMLVCVFISSSLLHYSVESPINIILALIIQVSSKYIYITSSWTSPQLF